MLIDVLARWNRWGTAKLEPGRRRELFTRLVEVLEMPEVVALVGSRRAGKTTLMYQLIEHLESTGVDPKAILHVNFEEPALAESMNVELLDRLYSTYRTEVYPEGKTYIFFDEIQNIPEWERWVRTRGETEDLKIFVTGSSSQLLSRELGTLLTGRHIQFTVQPLSFSEYLDFCGISFDADFPGVTAPPKIAHALDEFLKWGSYPRVVLTENDRQKELLLQRYFDDILFKDVAMRHEVRDVHALRTLALHLLAQTATVISYKRLARVFEVSEKLVGSYCQHIREAFLVDYLEFFSLKAAERNRNPLKVHANDLGMRHLMSLTHAPDKGRLAETAVHSVLGGSPRCDLYYWKGRGELDFLVRENNQITKLIQVVHSGLEDPTVLKREISSLTEAGEKFPQARKLLVAGSFPPGFSLDDPQIECIPLWKYLLKSA